MAVKPTASAGALAKKLGLKPKQRAIVRRCPPELQDDFRSVGAILDRGTIAELTLSFVRMQHEVENACKEAIALTAPGGVLWIAYPKKSGAIESDLSRDVGWEPFARAGWRPVSQVSIDDTWSALRFRPTDEVKKR
jgi:hypothetical protein